MKHLVLLYIFILLSLHSYSQCIKAISTNPNEPVNDEFLDIAYSLSGGTNYSNNSFLNTSFNWYYPHQITIDLTANWSHPISSSGSGSYTMVNPFSSSMPVYLRAIIDGSGNYWGDFYWEDGWELLWSNLGYYPNGDPIGNPSPDTYYGDETLFGSEGYTFEPSPSSVPYFVLYNRYTGLLRLFANVWFDNLNQSFQEIVVTLKYTEDSKTNKQLSGLLRNVSNYDVPLDQETTGLQIISPRFHPPNTNQWFVADFQTGFDPCICKFQGELQFEFAKFETLDVSIQSRSISVEDDLNSTNFSTHDFLNLPEDPDELGKPGTVIYQTMDGLMESYNNKLDKYNQELADYKAYENNLMIKFVSAAKEMVVGGLSSAVPWYGDIAAFLTVMGGQMGLSEPDREATEPVGNYTNGQSIVKGDSVTYVVVEGNEAKLSVYSTKKLDKSLQEDTKKVMGQGYDFLSTQVFGKKPEKPTKPSVPVATFTESIFKGEITSQHNFNSQPLYVPGSIPESYSPNLPDITPYNYPAYNEVLGLYALLETPKFKTYQQEFPGDTTGQEFHMGEFLREESGIDGSGVIEVYDGYYDAVAKDDLYFKLDEGLLYKLNKTVDFDDEKTKLYFQFELEYQVEGGSPEVFPVEVNMLDESNFSVSHVFPGETPSIIVNSKWNDLEDACGLLFKSTLQVKGSVNYEKHFLFDNHTHQEYDEYGNPIPIPVLRSWYEAIDDNLTIKLTKVKLKIMADMYFDQIGSRGEQVNTTQVFTYKLFDEAKGIDQFNSTVLNDPGEIYKYEPGIVELGGGVIGPGSPEVFDQVGNKLFINAEEIIVKGNVQVQPGYFLYLQALNEIKMLPTSSLSPNIHARITNFFPSCPSIVEATEAEAAAFCEGQENGYKANQLALLKSGSENEEEDNVVEEDSISLKIACYPNPTSRSVYVKVENPSDEMEVIVWDMQGRMIIHERITGAITEKFEIDLGPVASGIYFLRVYSQDGRVTSQRILKQ